MSLVNIQSRELTNVVVIDQLLLQSFLSDTGVKKAFLCLVFGFFPFPVACYRFVCM